jgi:hypothetical protein
VLKALEAITHASVPHITSDPDPHSAKKLRVNLKFSSEIIAVFSLQIGDNL